MSARRLDDWRRVAAVLRGRGLWCRLDSVGTEPRSRTPGGCRGTPSCDVTGKCRSAGGPDGLTVSRAPNAAGYVVERKVLRPQSGSI